MLFKVISRTVGAILLVMMFFLRACIFGHAIQNARRYDPHANAAYAYSYDTPAPVDYRNAKVAPATENSGWVLFTSADPQTGQRIRHARLTADSDTVTDGHSAPPNVLELMAEGTDNHYIRLTLQAPSTCAGITSVHAMFGKSAATLAVKPVEGHAAGCTLDMLDYSNILQSLLDADTLTVSAGNGPDIRFAVSGLSWD
jgi:hypothetical protein